MCHPVDAHGVVVEERAALGVREAAGDVVERAPDAVEAVAQAVDRIVAGEHRAPGAEQVDQRERHFSPRCAHPDCRGPEIFTATLPQAASPLMAARHAARSVAGGRPAWFTHDGGIGKIAREPRRLARSARHGACSSKCRPSGARRAIARRANARRPSCPGFGLLAHAAHEAARRVRFQDCRAIVAIEPGLARWRPWEIRPCAHARR